MNIDIVIIGGGPVGLWTAIQLKKRLPSTGIQVYERHQVYQRSHVLKLNHWSLMLYADVANDSLEKQFFADVTGKSAMLTRAQFTNSLYIRTLDLEDALRAYALALGITIVYERIESVAHAESLHPHCRLFIAADGARSAFREELFGKDSIDSASLQHVLELKFEERQTPGAKAKASKLPSAKLIKLNRVANHPMLEHVGRTRDTKTPVTLRLFLTPEAYKALPEMSFKAPHKLGEPGLAVEVVSDIEQFLAARASEGSELVDGSAKLTKLELNMYSAKHYAVMRAERGWFLVGDAAMGVPYFRALNSGLMLGSRLAQIIARTNYPQDGDLSVKVARYDKLHRPMHMATEFTIARGKNLVLEGAKMLKAQLSKASLD